MLLSPTVIQEEQATDSANTNSSKISWYSNWTSQVLGGLTSLLTGGLSASASVSPLSASRRGMTGSQKPGGVNTSDHRRFHVIGGDHSDVSRCDCGFLC